MLHSLLTKNHLAFLDATLQYKLTCDFIAASQLMRLFAYKDIY